jgi:hypothetical protein
MRFFVFVDTPYYPYVDDVIEADSLEEARQLVAQGLRPGDNTSVFLAPAESVAEVRLEGPRTAPRGLLKLLEESNRFHASLLDAKNLSGGFSVPVVVEPGTLGDLPKRAR